MNILMISKSEYTSDVRVRREAEALTSAGHHVTVIDAGSKDEVSNRVTILGTGAIPGLAVRRPKQSSVLYRIARWALLPEHRQRAITQFQQRALSRSEDLAETPDVIHAHDFPALEPAATLRERFGSRLVYDAHEYWSGLPRYGRPEPLRRSRNSAAERRLARSADRVITVSEGAASLLRHDFAIDEVSVVRNTFPSHPGSVIPEAPIGLVYAGRISLGRDLPTVFAASAWSDDFGLILMGPQDGSIPIPAWIDVLEPGSMGEVDDVLLSTGLSLVTLERGPVNHQIALPNKLFQAIAIGVPVVASNLPELARTVNEHGLGTIYQPGDSDSLSSAIQEVRSRYSEYKANVVAAQAELSWEVDSSVLLALYSSLKPSLGDS